jgi:hypothetical protein
MSIPDVKSIFIPLKVLSFSYLACDGGINNVLDSIGLVLVPFLQPFINSVFIMLRRFSKYRLRIEPL